MVNDESNLPESLAKIQERLLQEYDKLKKYYAATGFEMSFEKFAGILIAAAVLIFITLLSLHLSLAIALVAFLTAISMIIAIPLSVRNNRVAAMETNLPDALKHMALVLKAGGTTETAIEEISNADYGPISVELRKSLIQMREGKSFDAVLNEAAQNSGSLLFARTVNIVLDAKKAGAGLADVMFSIAEDARDVLHIKRERISRTTMHVMFLFVSGVVLAPFIFGFSVSIVHYINAGISSALPNSDSGNDSLCTLNLVLTVFIIAQTLIAALAIGLIRVGKFTKYLLYAPFLVLAALIIFEVGKFASSAIVGGPGITCG
ncbi:type II secretion system F family protein [Candidatus Micrarchaeota archaeon]|nr:type II secretion system F family protein [Candidatus Micrarchaeota archaeon]